MQQGYRLCLGCCEDWTYSADSLCPACQIEMDCRRAVKPSWGGTGDPTDWWGPTSATIDPGDIAEGFYVAHVGETPDSELFNVRPKA